MKNEHRQPIFAVTGANGKTTIARMIAHAFSNAGQTVEMIVDHDCAAVRTNRANNFSTNSTSEIAIVETALSRIADFANRDQRFDVSIIANLDGDCSKPNSCETNANDLKICSTVAERTTENGALILNADDELLARFANETGGKRVVCFSLKPNHIALKRSVLSSGAAYTIRREQLVELTAAGETPIVAVAEIRAAFGGAAEFNLANALAAAAACRAQNMEIPLIANALRTFDQERHNRGAGNLFEIDGAYAFLDGWRGLRAFKAICRTASGWNDGMRRINGIVQVPNDCSESAIQQLGRFAANSFHRVVAREIESNRSGANGETAQKLLRAVRSEAPHVDCCAATDESEALRREITRLQAGDILVCFCADYELARSILNRCDAAPRARVEPLARPRNFGLRLA